MRLGMFMMPLHPVLIASYAAMFDHLAKGRFIFGISPGALKSDAEALGTVNKMVGQILALRETAGDFGELVYANIDWADAALAKRSMELMATEVMPRVNKAIGAPAAVNAE